MEFNSKTLLEDQFNSMIAAIYGKDKLSKQQHWDLKCSFFVGALTMLNLFSIASDLIDPKTKARVPYNIDLELQTFHQEVIKRAEMAKNENGV